MRGGVLTGVVLVIIAIRFVMRMTSSPDVDTVLKQAVAGANEEIKSLKNSPEYKNAKCYRDGNGKGLVFEYVFSDEYSPETMDAAIVKSSIKSELGNNSNVRKVGEMGIYFKYIYKNSKEETLCSFKITASELAQ